MGFLNFVHKVLGGKANEYAIQMMVGGTGWINSTIVEEGVPMMTVEELRAYIMDIYGDADGVYRMVTRGQGNKAGKWVPAWKNAGIRMIIGVPPEDMRRTIDLGGLRFPVKTLDDLKALKELGVIGDLKERFSPENRMLDLLMNLTGLNKVTSGLGIGDAFGGNNHGSSPAEPRITVNGELRGSPYSAPPSGISAKDLKLSKAGDSIPTTGEVIKKNGDSKLSIDNISDETLINALTKNPKILERVSNALAKIEGRVNSGEKAKEVVGDGLFVS